MNKNIYLILLILTLQSRAFSFVDGAAPLNRETCRITVSLLGDISPTKAVNAWLGNYKIGFETFGSLKLEGIELGKKYIFAIPCYNTYIKLHFDYATQPFIGELRVLLEYRNQKMIVSLKAENCDESIIGENQLCTGVKEKLINNIALR